MINYSLTYNSWGNEEISAIQNVIKSNQFTYKNKVKDFEKKYSKYFKMKYSVMTNSGSSANLISIASLFYRKKNPLKRGDEVIVPSIAWATTYAPLQQYGLKLKILDVDFNTLNVSPKMLSEAISNKTKLVVAVSILGNPCKLHEYKKICDKKNIILIEDNCESLGAKINNKYTGTYGLLNTMSFFFSHHISTIEGGMVSTNDKEIYNILLSLRAHGWTRDQINFNKKKYEKYEFILPGYNVRPTELNAATGISQLKKLNKFLDIRRKNFSLYQKIFSNNKLFHIQIEEGLNSSFAFTFVFKKKYLNLKKKIFEDLKKEKIQFRLITGGCFTRHPVKKYFNFKIFKNLKNANYIHENGFFLGNAATDLSEQLIKFNKVIIKYY
jgi:CDP-6-deoxy-D-xylo-4-hexulose-3-dehydrase